MADPGEREELIAYLPRTSRLSLPLSLASPIRNRSEAATDGVLEVPASEPELDLILLNIPLQLLAYRLALARGTEIDQPGNLAKPVTVE